MDVRAKAVSLVLPLALLFGCSVGEVPGAGTTMTPDAASSNNNNNTAGEMSFNTTIKPLVMTKCTSCHAGTTPPNLNSFSMLEAKYKMKPGMTNVLVTKGDHAGIQYFNATEKTTVQNWIDSL